MISGAYVAHSFLYDGLHGLCVHILTSVPPQPVTGLWLVTLKWAMQFSS